MRVLMHAEVEVVDSQNRTIFQTVNVSVSGALLQGRHEFEPGQNFDFLFRLPGGGLIEGTAEVVRQTNPMREGIEGVGTRFTAFRGEGAERLQSHIDRQMVIGNNR